MSDDRQDERDQQERDSIDVRIDNAHDPVERVGRERETQYGGDLAARARSARQPRPVIDYCAVHTLRSR